MTYIPTPQSSAFSTTCFTGFDLLAAKFESPPYTAVTDVVPTLSVEVTNVAVPSLNVPVPKTVLPFMNETVSPSGGAGVTTAVKVTASPYVDGFGAEVSVVVVLVTFAGVSLNTVPQPANVCPFPPGPVVQDRSPPVKVPPYRLPFASRTKPEKGLAPSPPVPVKLYSTVSLPVVSSSNAVPQPSGALHARSPPWEVVPYRLPCLSCTKPGQESAPSTPPLKL